MLEISCNSMSIARSCWMKYKWRYVDRLTPIKKSTALSLGTVVHQAFDMYYNGFTNNEVTQFIINTMDEQIAKASPTEAEDLVVAKYTAMGMWMNYPTKDLTCFEEIKPELEFRIKIAPGVVFVGRVDGLVTHKGNRWVRELKTTGLPFSQFERRARTSPQATGYVYAAKKLGEDVQGIIYDYIKKPLLRKNQSEDMHAFGTRIMKDYRERPGLYFRRHYVYRNPVELAMFEQGMLDQVKEIKRRWKSQEWYRNQDQCWNFNAECPYMKICFSERPDPLTINLYYNKKDMGRVK